jgi:spore coat protein U-like protein
MLGTQACLAATTCSFVSGGGVAFGPYDTLSAAPTDSALDLRVSCSRSGGPQNVSVTVSLGIGSYGTSVSNRRMAGGGGDFLSYGLFRDVSRSGAWGFTPGIDTVSQTISVPNKGSATATFTVYGRIPSQQDVSQGGYSDTIQVTLSP